MAMFQQVINDVQLGYTAALGPSEAFRLKAPTGSMLSSCKKRSYRAAVFAALLGLFPVVGRSQQYNKTDREIVLNMLRNVAEDVQKRYYDPKLHGVDWDARMQEAKKNIDAAHSMNAAISEVATLLNTLNDSHTFLVPPPSTHIHDYGFQIEMIGDRCYVIRVRPGSDALKKGLKPGDQILAINENPVSRKNFWRMVYIFNVLRPQLGLRLTLVDEAEHQRQLEVMATFQLSTINNYFLRQGSNQRRRDVDEENRVHRARYYEKGEGLLVVKIPVFAFSDSEVDSIIGKMRAHKGVVLDLRGNPGGFLDTLDRLLGGILENDTKICDRIGRDASKSLTAIGRHHSAFTGRFAVLVDSESASASELTARVVQLEKRGQVVGDRSAGAVMAARYYPHEFSVNTRVFYAVSVTEGDLVMADGKSLEHTGVDPDIVVLPTPLDLASKRDPAMAKAAELVGVELSPEEAGKIPPYEESPEFGSFLSLND
jgi:carboxyl-terminal processing protease